jgi:MPBQ/MSBQ methyltransferase
MGGFLLLLRLFHPAPHLFLPAVLQSSGPLPAMPPASETLSYQSNFVSAEPASHQSGGAAVPDRLFEYNYFEYGGFDLELYFVREILGLESLHYGCFELHEPLTLETVRRAQHRYTQSLVEMLPSDVERVIDVGCGMGDVARAMARRGKTVVALSPDRNHGQYVAGSHPDLTFVNEKFETFMATEPADLVLMSESQNYFDTVAGLRQVRRCIRPGGYLLISGMFVKEPCAEFRDIINTEGGYFEAAADHGFDVIKRSDITEEVSPTLEFARRSLEQFVEPLPRLLDHYMRARSPVKYWFLRTFFRRQFKDYQRTLDYYHKRFDQALFKEKVRYLRVLFRQSTNGSRAGLDPHTEAAITGRRAPA